VRRWTRARALLLALATTAAAVVGTALPRAADADGGLVQQAEWHPFPKDTAGHGYVAVDSASRIGYAFSGALTGQWTRVQAVNLDTGKNLGTPLAIPPVGMTAPSWVDTKRHVLVYAESYPSNAFVPPTTQHLYGLAFRNGQVERIFTVDSPVGSLRIASLVPDEATGDLLVLGTTDKMSQSLTGGPSVIDIQRISMADLAAGRVVTRWTEALRLPQDSCPALVGTDLPTEALVVGDTAFLPCRGPANDKSGTAAQTFLGAQAGVVAVRGVGPQRAAEPAITVYRTSGDYYKAGAETAVDRRMRRLLLVETGYTPGLRVFDTDHRRYVGRINGNAAVLFGQVVDQMTSRVYFISKDGQVGLGYADDAALVPTQGERLKVPYAALFATGNARRLSFDEKTKRLLVPLRRQNDTGALVESVLVMKDVADPYVPPPAIDPAYGAVDLPDVPGKTESEHAATARAVGADYQLIGGTMNLVQNVLGTDGRGQFRPGTRHLRQAYVESANLTDDGAIARATAAQQDDATLADRNEVQDTAGHGGGPYAPLLVCTDYAKVAAVQEGPGATARCDLAKATVAAKAAYDHAGGVMITGGQTTVPAPVQMGDSTVEVVEQRAAGRGALTTKVTAIARNVTIGGVVSFGRVEQRTTLTAHGRSGTAKLDRAVVVTDVEINGTPFCGLTCSLSAVTAAVNKAANGRFWVDFPTPTMTVDKRGTYAEVTQDPYLHAERKLDYDKAEDDFVVPAMSVVYLLDGMSKSRLVTDFAAVSGTNSYRVYPVNDFDFGDGEDPVVDDDGGGGELPRPVATIRPEAPKPDGSAPAPQPTTVAGGSTDDGPIGALIERVRLSLRSLGDALPLLLIWALLGVPAYLSARRRLLLELPMLTRDEELT
jgi:hypothetical protein